MSSRSVGAKFARLLIWTIGIIAISLRFSSADTPVGNSIEEVDIVSEGRRAEPIEEKPPAFPLEAKNRLIEGWVQLKYLVNPDGTTSEIKIIDSSVEGLFDRAAVDAVGEFKYKPAVWNGFPATDVILDKNIFFFFSRNEGDVNRDFYTRFSAASSAISEGDLEKARGFIEELERRKQWLIAEICYLDLLKGDLWRATGNKAQALHFYNRALVVAPGHAKRDVYESLLRRAFVLNAEQGSLAAALHNYRDLANLVPGMRSDDSAHGLAERIRKFVDGDQPYVSAGVIEQRCKDCGQLSSAWTRELLRDRFTVEKVEGEVSEIKIICGEAYVSFVYEPGFAWDVASRWGECKVMVLGEEGTTFHLVEL